MHVVRLGCDARPYLTSASGLIWEKAYFVVGTHGTCALPAATNDVIVSAYCFGTRPSYHCPATGSPVLACMLLQRLSLPGQHCLAASASSSQPQQLACATQGGHGVWDALWDALWDPILVEGQVICGCGELLCGTALCLLARARVCFPETFHFPHVTTACTPVDQCEPCTGINHPRPACLHELQCLFVFSQCLKVWCGQVCSL